MQERSTSLFSHPFRDGPLRNADQLKKVWSSLESLRAFCQGDQMKKEMLEHLLSHLHEMLTILKHCLGKHNLGLPKFFGVSIFNGHP